MNKQCFEIFEKAPPSDNSFYTLAMMYFDIANLNIYANQYDKSIEMFKKSLFYLEKSKNIKEKKYSDHFKAFILTLLANIYTDKEQYKQAKKYIDEASILEKKDPNPIARINIYRDVSIIYLANNQPQLAIDTLSKIINSDNIPSESRAAFYDILAHSYKKLHNKDKEILYMNKLDSINSLKSANEKKTANIISKIASEELQDEKDYLFKTRLIYAITILAFFILLTFLYKLYKKKITEQKRLYEEFTEKIRNNKPIPIESKISLTESREREIISRLDNFEEKKMYLNKDISLPNLATKFKTNTVYLSDVINKHKKKNFNSYINELRINYITKEIYNNPKFSQYKISYLADLCGFSSHSIFASTFKKITGMSPSVYIQMCRDNQATEKINITTLNSQ
ncbi:helix-turn-helix domain-containing protein [Chryseobacterium sp. EO14]|nr:helix-turn-helix domain-containing protein [Chryseobacterium sp. EO14]MCQ4138763.1 helix-turn-helix domain-containing protein [Chryseobacterium sp. EO14]